MRRFLSMFLPVACSLAAAPALGADYCVTSGGQLRTALEAAAASDEDDSIRIGASALTLASDLAVVVRGSLEIRGGFGSTCLLSPASAASTITAAGHRFDIELLGADLTLNRVHFSGFGTVHLDDRAQDTTAILGRILVQRVAVSGGVSGMLVASWHRNVRVENSIFRGASDTDGNIFAGAGLVAWLNARSPVVFHLLNNTAVENRFGFTVYRNTTSGGEGGFALLENNVLWNNRNDDLLVRDPVIARHNIWLKEDFFGGGSVVFPEGNLTVDPMLDAELRPLEPSSPVIDSGIADVNEGLPASDHDGGKRLVGAGVDRGAYESTVNSLPVLTVTSTANTGAGTLRQALLDANSHPDPTVIEFDIAGSCPRNITVASALPVATAPVRIDGYSQPGSVANASARGFDATLCVGLNGAGSVPTGLHLEVPAGELSVVEGMAFYGFSSEAVLVSGEGAGTVRGNAFGTGTGLVAPGFDAAAVRVREAPGSVIGGTDVASRNLIGRALTGVMLEGSDAKREVRGNLIGLDASGSGPLANTVGVMLAGGYRDVVTRNQIGFNSSHGVLLDHVDPPTEAIITVNEFGLTANYGDAGNGGNGIRVRGGEGHAIEHNLIRFGGTDGIAILAAARRVSLYLNHISDNALQAVDLSPDGINAIDLDVGATGANDSQNAPMLQTAGGSPTLGRVQGELQSANGTYLIQFFRNLECDANGYGEAGGWIGETTVTISNATPSANGFVSFQADVIAPSATLLGRSITAIARDEERNSSETSNCVPYVQGPELFRDGFE